MKIIFRIILVIILTLIVFSPFEAANSHEKTKNDEPVLLLFTPGLEIENISGAKAKLIPRSFTGFSKFPLINFLEILLGAEVENQLNSLFYRGGKIISLQRAQLQKLSWLDLTKDFVVFVPYSGLLKSTEVKKRTRSPDKVAILVREREIAFGEKFLFFVKPRGSRPGAKWQAIVRKRANEIILELPPDISVFGSKKNTVEMKKNKGVLLLLHKGNRLFNLYLHLRDFFKNKVIFYQKGPQKGAYLGKPDYTGLKREYIGSAIFGEEFLVGLQVYLKNILLKKRKYNLLYLNFAAELEKYLMRYDQKEIVDKWKNIVGKKLNGFIEVWKDSNPGGKIYWIGMNSIMIVEKRLDLAQLLQSDKLILLENGSEALLYPWSYEGNIWEFYHYIAKKINKYSELSKYLHLVPHQEFIKVKIRSKYRAGSCRRGNFVCADYSEGKWGYPGTRIWFYSNDQNLPGELRSPSELGEYFFHGLER